MSHIFSQKLIRETILVFYEEDGIELSPEQANEYLQNLSGFFLAFARPSFKDGGQIEEII